MEIDQRQGQRQGQPLDQASRVQSSRRTAHTEGSEQQQIVREESAAALSEPRAETPMVAAIQERVPGVRPKPAPQEAPPKAPELPERKPFTIKLYSDSLPAGVVLDDVSFPKLTPEQLTRAKQPPAYKVDFETRRITNSVEMGLTTARDDPKRPNVAVMDIIRPELEAIYLDQDSKLYSVYSSHMRAVIDQIGPKLELRDLYQVGLTQQSEHPHSLTIVDALKEILRTLDESKIKYLNCSFTRTMTYPEATEIMKKFGPAGYAGTVTPESLAADRPALDQAIRKYAATAEGQREHSYLLEEAALYQQLSDRGVRVVMGAGNSGKASFNPLHVLVPDAIVVTGISEESIAKSATDHSLVDTAALYRAGVNRQGTSMSTPAVLGAIEEMISENQTIPRINEVLRADLEVRVRGKKDTITLSVLKPLIAVLESSTAKEGQTLSRDTLQISAMTMSALSERFFASETEALKVMTDYPTVSVPDALRVLRALDRALPGELMSTADFRAVYGAVAAGGPAAREITIRALEAARKPLKAKAFAPLLHG